MKLASKARHRASADERRRYGGSTVTEFWVMPDEKDASTWFTVMGYGPTPGDRKTDARKRAEQELIRRALRKVGR